MNYELAKQLKDAGFPQEFGKGYKSHGKIPINSTAAEMGRIECYFPTLEELIDAIGSYTVIKAIQDGELLALDAAALALYWLALNN